MLTARFALLVFCCLTTAVPAQAKSGYLQCVPYAREVSGVNIHGNAWTWWGQADGIYERGGAPRVGSVMSFQRIRSMPLGHVAMVSKIVSDREVLLRHANWSRRGGIERDVRAIDVSAAGDWSQVRVWYAPIGGLGSTVYPINGFIYPDAVDDADGEWAQEFAATGAQEIKPVLVASIKLDMAETKLKQFRN